MIKIYQDSKTRRGNIYNKESKKNSKRTVNDISEPQGGRGKKTQQRPEIIQQQ